MLHLDRLAEELTGAMKPFEEHLTATVESSRLQAELWTLAAIVIAHVASLASLTSTLG